MKALAKCELEKRYEHIAQYIGIIVKTKKDNEDFPKLLGLGSIHNSFINNLKAALTHYKQMGEYIKEIETKEQEDYNLNAYKHYELIGEHITTGLVDYHVDMMQHFARYYSLVIKCVSAERDWLLRSPRKVKKIINVDMLIYECESRKNDCLNYLYAIRSDMLSNINTLDWDVVDINDSMLNKLTLFADATTKSWHSFQLKLKECIKDPAYLDNIQISLRSATRNNGHIHRAGTNYSINAALEKLKNISGYITIEAFLLLNPQVHKKYYNTTKAKRSEFVKKSLNSFYWYVAPTEPKIICEEPEQNP